MIIEREQYRAVAVHGEPNFAEYWLRLGWIRFPTGEDTLFARLGRGELIHIPDVSVDDGNRKSEEYHRLIELSGARSLLLVPLRKDDVLLGAVTAFRKEARPFTNHQIVLLQNFAAHAVIAMENARLITETREALEQQTATAEVLQVINSSPGDLTPVFNAMLEKATSLCEAAYGTLFTYDGERFNAVALRGVPAAFSDALATPVQPEPGAALDRLVRGERFADCADVANEAEYGGPAGRALIELGGARSTLAVPLRKDDVLLGAFAVYRQEVHPFSEKQIALLQNFAAQAVIAMENARLITETREALEQQTATSEVLAVINSSPGDLAPVFDAILEKAMHLCEAAFGALWTYDGEYMHAVATRGVPSQMVGFLRKGPHPPARVVQQSLVDGAPYEQIADLRLTDGYRDGDPLPRAGADLGGVRTLLGVALRKNNRLLGVFGIYRQEVRPFSDKQIALLQSFAAQAVIAMDNARLLNEIRQRQAELRVTFDNMSDGVAMFDAKLRLAARNLNFQHILDLPDEFLTGRPSVAEFVRYLAEHGEYGEVNVEAEVRRLSERVGVEWSAERTRPDGRVIEVRNNPVPGGGFVLIYSDITERKRSEAEIHAARDAAEAAYRDLKAAQSSLIQAQKMAALGQLTAGIAHEIKNPLNFVNNFAGLSVELLDELKGTAAPAIEALDEDKRAEIDETIEMLTGNLEKIAEHGQRADNIVKSMLEHSRGVTSERRKVDLNNLVEEALNLAYHGARAQDQNFNITLERDYDRDLDEIELVPQEVNRVFINLIGNGFYAATKRQRDNDGPDFRPTLTVATRDLGGAVEVRIRDNGIGIPSEIKDKLFQPFFTTKPTGEGTGLGLSISYDIVTQQHGGTIEVDSQVGEFTEFTVRLPRAYRPTTAEAAS
jgi:signal transduction histidine kinase